MPLCNCATVRLRWGAMLTPVSVYWQACSLYRAFVLLALHAPQRLRRDLYLDDAASLLRAQSPVLAAQPHVTSQEDFDRLLAAFNDIGLEEAEVVRFRGCGNMVDHLCR